MKTISDAKQQLEKSLLLIETLKSLIHHPLRKDSYGWQQLDKINDSILSGIFALDVANSLLDLNKENEFDLTVKQAQINSQATHNLSKIEFFTD